VENRGPAGKACARGTVSFSGTSSCRYRFAMARAGHEEIRAERGALFGSTCDAAQRNPSFTLRVSLHGRFREKRENAFDKAWIRENIFTS